MLHTIVSKEAHCEYRQDAQGNMIVGEPTFYIGFPGVPHFKVGIDLYSKVEVGKQYILDVVEVG